MDLFGMFMGGVISWGIGRTLDYLFKTPGSNSGTRYASGLGPSDIPDLIQFPEQISPMLSELSSRWLTPKRTLPDVSQKALDTLVVCDNCGQQDHSRIENVQSNILECSNCHKTVNQFTNACNYTVGQNGEIGHVGIELLGGWNVNRDPANNGFFSPAYEGWLFFNINARARDMLGKQFVLSGEISDYDSGRIYTRNSIIYNCNYNDALWNQNARIPLKWYDIPDTSRDNRIFAVDIYAKTEYGDILCKDRLLANIFK